MDDVKTEDLVNQMNIQALKSYNVQISSDSKYWENYILFITPSELVLSFNNQIFSHFWKTISRFDYNNHNIYISFDESNYIIQSPNVANLISDLCEILQRVLLPSELANIDFAKLNTPQIGPGTESADSRFLMQQTGNLHTNTSKKEITSLIKYATPYFRISNASEVGFLFPNYLDVLPFIKTLKIIEFPIIGVDYMKSISNFPVELRYTHKIEINGSVNPILFTFLERVKQNQKQSKLTSLSFSLANFNRNDLSTISNSITKGPINSIEFHRSFHPSSVPYFYSTFLSHQINGLLWILNLDKTIGLDLRKLFPKVRNIPFLSLAFCELDIIEVLTVASESKLAKTTILNLTGNNALSSSIEKVKNIQSIPSLKKLIFDKINWPDHFIVQFLKTLFDKFRGNLALSFSNAVASKDEWSDVFSFMETAEFDGLIGLSWNSNPVHKNLFNFLNRCGQLRTLEFDACFDESSPDLVSDLASVVKSSRDLVAVSVAGSKEKHAGRQIASVVEACAGKEKLRRVNFPFSYGGDDLLPLVVRLIESTPAVRAVNFEGLGMTDHSSFLDSMMKLSKSLDRVKVNFPFEDVKQFGESLSKDDQKELKNAYRRSYNDPPVAAKPARLAISAAEQPFLNKKRVYSTCAKKENFPPYITSKTIERLKEELVDVPDHLADRQKIESDLSKSYVKKKPAGTVKVNKKLGTSLSNTTFERKMIVETKSAKVAVEEEEEENDRTYDDSLNDSHTESEHPLQDAKGDASYSDSLETKPPHNRQKKPTTAKTNDSLANIEKLEENSDDDDDDDSLTQSLSSLSNPASHLIRKSSNMPKNLALSDYSEEPYDHSTFKSPETSKVTLSSGDFDSLSNSYTIEGVEFDAKPSFEPQPDYKFSSDLSKEDEKEHQQLRSGDNNQSGSDELLNFNPSPTFKKPRDYEFSSDIRKEDETRRRQSNIDDVEFNPTPIFDKPRDYKFSSDLGPDDEMSKPHSNFDLNSEDSENSNKPKKTTTSNNKDEEENKPHKNRKVKIVKKKKAKKPTTTKTAKTTKKTPPSQRKNKPKTNKKKKNQLLEENDDDDDDGVIEKLDLFEEEEEESTAQVNERGIDDVLLSEYSSSLVNTATATPTSKNGDKFAFDIEPDAEIKNDKNYIESNEDDQNGLNSSDKKFISNEYKFNSEQNKFDYEEEEKHEDNKNKNNKNIKSKNVSVNDDVNQDDSYRSYDQNGTENENEYLSGYSYGYSDGYYDYHYDGYSYSNYSEPEAKVRSVRRSRHGSANNNDSLEIEIQNDHQSSIQVEINSIKDLINKAQNQNQNQNDSENERQQSQSQTPKEIQFPIRNEEEEDSNKRRQKRKRSSSKIGDSDDAKTNGKVKRDDDQIGSQIDEIAKSSEGPRTISNNNSGSGKISNNDEIQPDTKPKTASRQPHKTQVRVQKPNPIEIQAKTREAEPATPQRDGSSESSELNFTPTTPNLSIFTKSIFNFYKENESDDVDDTAVSREEMEESKKWQEKSDPRLPPIGSERDWKFPIHFDMEPDLSQFKKIFKKYSPDFLYDQLSHEKSFPSRASTPKAKK